MKPRDLALILGGLALMTGGAFADPVADILSEAGAFCASFENGTFEAGTAVTEADLDGNGVPDQVVDTSQFSCTSMASAYCGSGGCTLHTVVGDQAWSFQVEGWRMIDWDGHSILLLARDGSWCGASGAQMCFEAISWSDGQMLTVMPPS